MNQEKSLGISLQLWTDRKPLGWVAIFLVVAIVSTSSAQEYLEPTPNTLLNQVPNYPNTSSIPQPPIPTIEASPNLFTATDSDLGDLDDLLNADLDQLSQADVLVPAFDEEVTTVSRQESTIGRSPAAVYVITNEMIRRSGSRSIPDALRLAPGVQVARIDANKWAISIRGFNQRFSNKLLVQIDGRTVYTPLFGGVFWDIQDVLLEDVERIEIIRGPGATVWGANAVNGVINILTKNSSDTKGIFAEGGGGNQQGFASARVGNRTQDVDWRVYGKWFDQGPGLSADGTHSDDWRMGRVGFRMDWSPNCCDTLTLQGDLFDGRVGQYQKFAVPPPTREITTAVDSTGSGGNGLFRWTRDLGCDSDWSLQLYYDRTEILNQVTRFSEHRDTYDLDFQYHKRLNSRHDLIWGLGYRNTTDQIQESFDLQFMDLGQENRIYSTFIQDEITLIEDTLALTLGSKFSNNDFTGFEIQPTARLLYTPTDRKTYWASISRAVRTPSRVLDDVRVFQERSGIYQQINGNSGVNSEQLLALEAGYRTAPSDELFFDVAMFYNMYEDLSVFSVSSPGVDAETGYAVIPVTLVNGADAQSYGFELSSTWEVNSCWTLRSAYSFLSIDMHPDTSIITTKASDAEGQSPRNQFFLHSSWDIACNWEFDLIGRYVDSLSIENVPSYFELDSRLAWRPSEVWELSLTGRNLLDNAHPEFGSDAGIGVFATEIRRELFGAITLRY